MQSLCVFCGSSNGSTPGYRALATDFGLLLAARGIRLVYGGGRVGLMDELFEAWTWTQLGLQRKPSGLLNAGGFYDPLLSFLDRATKEGFMRASTRDALIVDSDMTVLLDRLTAAVP